MLLGVNSNPPRCALFLPLKPLLHINRSLSLLHVDVDQVKLKQRPTAILASIHLKLGTYAGSGFQTLQRRCRCNRKEACTCRQRPMRNEYALRFFQKCESLHHRALQPLRKTLPKKPLQRTLQCDALRSSPWYLMYGVIHFYRS
jgi:hypothetical protein